MLSLNNKERENEVVNECYSSLFKEIDSTNNKFYSKSKKPITIFRIKNIIILLFFLFLARFITKSKIFGKIFYFVIDTPLNQPELFSPDDPYFKYFENCRNMKKLYQDYYTGNVAPKITIIIPVFNRGIYIDSLICSLENQQIKSFEVVFIDDLSSDNSVEIIENYTKKDSRIQLIKNKENKGVFRCRYLGTLYSKGKYIYFIDPDDLVNDILYEAYDLAIYYNLDIVEFDYVEYTHGEYKEYNKKFNREEIIKGEEVKYIMFLNSENASKFHFEHGMIWDKLIKKGVLIKAYENIGDKYLNEHLITWDDSLVSFFVYKNSKSYKYLKKVGYSRYIDTVDSIDTTNRKMVNSTIVNKKFHDIFTYLKIVYEKSEDTKKDRLSIFQVWLILQKMFGEKIIYLTDNLDLVAEVFQMYRSIKYLRYKERKKIESYYKQFEKALKKVS